MPFDWTQEQHATLARFRDIGAEIAAAAAHDGRAPAGFDEAGWARLGHEGLWDMIVPETYGGDGHGWWHFSAALEGLASSIRRPALLLSVIAQAGMVRALERYGTATQQDRYFGAILRGELSATAIAEPGTGTDVRSIATTLAEHGDGYRLTGSKFNIAHAPLARFILVVTRIETPGRRNTALAIVDRDQPGMTVAAPDRKLGLDDLPTGALHFDDCPITRGQLLGEPGAGLGNLIDIISLGRLYYGLVAAQVTAPYLRDAIGYCRERRSFDSTIDAHQYVQRRLVDLQIGIERGTWLARGALAQLLTDHPQALMTCSIAKLVGAQDLVDSALGLVRLYGSLGYQAGPVAAFASDALGFMSVGGTEEMHRKNIFNQMMRAG
ncbi:acyl-CoA dehydrogenase family protein [Burkholderia seminalis]|uniref:acyl-CoA dehydrogenase family protein n=1 Tax=Burkholderia seminalis TaxID=488731 RepID=UPI0007571A1C|nr:acyl-CoA dehydrogenase family protein [Burkholderia seminalis]AOJ24877.1 acyl-CoA dehydrogenase [Burkholderia seminalis]KVF48399.1 acyl-CoA dehydrogenase [Burkholderia seminalis]MCA8039212.1 acyl-CoA dehydrogenase family protein [Burkholderia seminalis]